MSTPKNILIVGGAHLRYHALELQERAGLTVTRMKIPEALKHIAKHTEEIDLVITELYADDWHGLDRGKTQKGLLAGAVLFEKIRPLCPRATFMLLDGAKQGLLEEDERVRFLPPATELTCDLLAGLVVEHFRLARANGHS